MKYICREYISNFDEEAMIKFLTTSPNYPSLLSIVQTLRYMGLNVQTGKCDFDYLKKINQLVLIHVKIHHKEQMILVKWDDANNYFLLYSVRDNLWKPKGLSDISKVWDGVVIYIEQPIIKSVKSKINLIEVAAFILLLFESLFFIYYGLIKGLMLLVIIFGLLLSLYKLAKDYGYNNQYLDKLCHITTKTSCDYITISKYSNIFGYLMSEFSLSYFISQLILSFILLSKPNITFSVFEPTIIVFLPILIYSAYAQIKVKYFCPYCISIILILMIQAILVLIYGKLNSVFFSIIVILLTAFFAGICKEIRRRKTEKNKFKQLNYKLLSLKRKGFVVENESVFLKIERLPILLEYNNSKTKNNTVITIISPSCPACQNIVNEMYKLIDTNRLIFKWIVILGKSQTGDDNVNRQWINMYLNNPQHFFKYLRCWSISGNKFQKNNDIINSLEQENIINQVIEGFNNTICNYNITSFPRIVINSRLLSTIYTGADIEYIIMDMEIEKNNMVPFEK